MRFLHLADVHLGTSYAAFGSMAAERAREVLDAFRRLPDRAAELRVDAVLFAGDLFDGPRPEPETLAAVRDVLRRLVDLCIPVFVVPGNHDSVTLKLNPYRELARGSRVVVQDGGEPAARDWLVKDEAGRRLVEKHSVYLLTRPRFGEPVTVETEAGPLHVHGVAYDAAECRDPIATFDRGDAPGVHVALLHCAVHDASHWRASPDTLATTTEALRGLRADYIALGDFHRPRAPEELDGLPACYPGSFAATDLTESGARGFVVVDVERGKPPAVEHHDAGVRPVAAVELDVAGHESDIEIGDAAARALPAAAIPVVRLVGEPSFPLDADAVAVGLRERYGHAAVVDETRYYAAERLDELSRRDTVVGHVVRLGRRRVAEAGSEREREVAQRALRLALRALEAH